MKGHLYSLLIDTFFYKYQKVCLTITVQNCIKILSDKFSTFIVGPIQPYLNNNTDRTLDVVFSHRHFIQRSIARNSLGFRPQGYYEQNTPKS